MKFILILFTFCTFLLHGQHAEKPLTIGTAREIHSTELEEKRILNIYLPEGYSADSATTYPVIYLLDGSANEDFIHIVGLVQFLVMIEKIPQSIVVGIANVDRKRDFTIPTTIEQDKKDFPTTGGSETFIHFIENELQPFIAKEYKTSGSKTIIGQSLGGLLATEILIKKPDLFNNYLIVSPSLWWDNESLLEKAPELLKSIPKKNLSIYISVGKEGKIMERDAKKLSKTLKKSGQENVTFYFMPTENHATILHKSAYHGLEIIHSKKN